MSTDAPSSTGGPYPGEHRCLHCGSHVTRDYARVFGNNQNEVWRCHNCEVTGKVRKGAAKAPNADTDWIGSFEIGVIDQ